MEVKVHEAKTHLSRLLQRVEAGEEITIARLVPIASSRAAAQGMNQGRIWMAEDFDAPDPELEALFEGTTPKKVRGRKAMNSFLLDTGVFSLELRTNAKARTAG